MWWAKPPFTALNKLVRYYYYRQGGSDLFLSSLSSSPTLIHFDVIVNAATRLCTQNIAYRLLKRGAIWFTDDYTSSASESSACRCTFGSESWLSWLRDASNERDSLATNRLPHQIQIMSHDARSSKQQKPGIYYRYTRPDIISASPWVASFAWVRRFRSTRVRTDRVWKKSFSIADPMIWNELPHNIWRTDNVTTFKRVLKAHLFKLAYDCWRFFSSLTCVVKHRWTMFG